MMKKLFGILFALVALAGVAFAGTESYSSSKEVRQSTEPAPCPEWYADNEWQIALWGTYAFSTDNDDDIDFDDDDDFDPNIIGDNAWGGGIDVKYFFRKYFGVGIEAYGLATDGSDVDVDFDDDDDDDDSNNDDGVGSIKGTFTFRYPIPCSRVAPYVFAGGGVIFGGVDEDIDFDDDDDDDDDDNEDARAIGQVGAGFEVRFTQHIGWMNDFSWNFTDGSDFGMVRTGVTFAF